MKKSIKKMLITIIFLFIGVIDCVKADIISLNGSDSSSLGTMGTGKWLPSAFGLKISIVDSDSNLKDVEIILNEKGNYSAYFSSNNSPKFLQPENIEWSQLNYTYTSLDLPNSWKDSDDKVFKLEEFLINDDFMELKKLLDKKDANGNSIFSSLTNGDYIIVEPMTKIDKYYGTAYELANSFLDNSSFKTNYKGAIFAGNYYSSSKKVCRYTSGGIFYTSIYLKEEAFGMNLPGIQSVCTKDNKQNNNAETMKFKDKRYMRGVGVYAYSDVYRNSNYTLTIKKTDASTTQPMSNVNFTLTGNGQTLSGKTNINGILEFTVPVSSTPYTLTESVPTNLGYSSSTVNCTGCETINNNVMTVLVNADKIIQITNSKDCDLDLARYTNPTKDELISLYNTHRVKGLLNFSNPSCSNNIIPDYNLNDGCLHANITINNFNSNNLSGYETLYAGSNSYKAFCGHTFNFTNIYNITNVKDFGTNKAGQLIVNVDSTNGKIGEGQVIENCYVFGNVDEFLDNEILNNYSSYIGNVNFAGQTLVADISASLLNPQKHVESNYTLVSLVYNAKYSLKPIYLQYITGKVENIDCTNCSFLSYGIISKLNEKSGRKYMNFNIKDPDDETKNIVNVNNKCTYSVENEIIHLKNGLNIEFRTFQNNNAFPGNEGDGRIVGSNWCYGDDCNSTNSLIANIMNNRNNSYNKMNSKPLYRIVLNSSIIKSIREYNKINPYDDNYNLICDDNNKCKSKFLEDYGFTRTIEKIQWLDDYESI